MENHSKLLSFKLTNKGAQITFTENVEEEKELTYKEHGLKIERQPSEKLKIALRTLLTHALIKCELTEGKIKEKEVNSRKAVDMPCFKGYSVEGFSIKGDAEDEKLSLKISKTTSKGDVFSIAVPDILIVDENNPFENQLAEDLDNVIKECIDYKNGVNYFVQCDLFQQKVASGSEEDEDI